MAIWRLVGLHSRSVASRSGKEKNSLESQGLPQFIQLRFENAVIPRRISLMFQGGFVGTRCAILASFSTESAKEWRPLMSIYPENVNRRQTFDIHSSNAGVRTIKLVFEESSDFFGRITVYDLRIEGSVISSV